MDEQQFGFDLSDGVADREDSAFAPDMIRREALSFLAEARAITSNIQWDAGEVRYRRILFPHLVSWLPNIEERDQLCFEFTRELDRIELLLAA